MARSTYKVPAGFNPGIYHRQERHGFIITYRDENIALLQKDLISGYNHLSYAHDELKAAQSWFYQVPDTKETSYMEMERDKCLKRLRDERDDVVKLMSDILKAGAEPLTPDEKLDSAVALVLDTGGVLLHGAAVADAGGEDAVEAFRISAQNSVTEAITRSVPILMAGLYRHQREQEQAAEQRTAEAQAMADNEAQVFAQGPSAAAGRRFMDGERRRQEEEQRRKQALEKLKAKLKEAKEKRQRRS